LSVVLPAYKEGHRIRATVDVVREFCMRECTEWEVIVVDDGSNDGTSASLVGVPGVRCLRNDMNRGKGFSVRRGVLEARHDAVLFSDVDLSTPIEEALHLHEAIAAGADVAIGCRRRDAGKVLTRTPLRRLMAAVFRMLVKVIVIRGFHDTQCGFKMFRMESARSLFPLQRLERWGFDVELLYIAKRKGLKIASIPVAYRESPESRLSPWTPFTMVRDLLHIRWNALVGRYETRGKERVPVQEQGKEGTGLT
jgi:glycosyltransferase involved in cell wall biosynthesis